MGKSSFLSVLGLGVAFGLAWIAPCTALAQPQPLVVETLTIATPGGTARGFLASVHLQDPSVEIVVTGPASPGSGGDAILTTTPSFRTATNSRLAINANFFSTISGSIADTVGLVVSNGAVVSPVRTYSGVPDRSWRCWPEW